MSRHRYRRGRSFGPLATAALGVLLIAALGGWPALAVLVSAIVIVAISMMLEDRRRNRR